MKPEARNTLSALLLGGGFFVVAAGLIFYRLIPSLAREFQGLGIAWPGAQAFWGPRVFTGSGVAVCVIAKRPVFRAVGVFLLLGGIALWTLLSGLRVDP